MYRKKRKKANDYEGKIKRLQKSIREKKRDFNVLRKRGMKMQDERNIEKKKTESI